MAAAFPTTSTPAFAPPGNPTQVVARAGLGNRTADRAAPGGDKLRMVSLRLPQDLIEELKRLASSKSPAWPYQALARSVLTDFVAVARTPKK